MLFKTSNKKLKKNLKLNLYDSVSRVVPCCYPENPQLIFGLCFALYSLKLSACIGCMLMMSWEDA